MGYDVWDPKERNAATIERLQNAIDCINSGKWQVVEYEEQTSEQHSIREHNRRITANIRLEAVEKVSPVRSVRVY